MHPHNPEGTRFFYPGLKIWINIQTYIAFLKTEKLNYFKIIFQNSTISLREGCKHNSGGLDPIIANLTPNLKVRTSLPKELQEKAKVKKGENLLKYRDQEKLSTLNLANVTWWHKTYKSIQLLHYSNIYTFLSLPFACK